MPFHCLGVYAAARSSVPARGIAGAYMGHGGWGEQRKEESGLRRSVSLSGNLRQGSAWNLDPKLQIRQSIGELE